IVLGIAIFIFVVLGSFFVSISITRPLAKLVNFSELLAQGKLNLEISTSGKDEIAQVFMAYQRMIDSLKKVITNIRHNANELANASIAISNVAQNIAKGANSQAVSTEEIAAAIEEIAASIRENSLNSEQAQEIAQMAAFQIIEGRITMTDMAQAMTEIQSKIAIVNEIAYKTDLLAINAAIEAGRAGVLGKGFSVVALEVRKLAETSNKAAKLIDELIRTNAERVVGFSNELTGIADNVEKTARSIKEISTTGNEQQSSSSQVNLAVQELNITTQQNSATAEELSTSAEQLENQAQGLMNSINFFVLERADNTDRIADLKLQVAKLIHTIDTLSTNAEGKEQVKTPPNHQDTNPETTSTKGVRIDISRTTDATDKDYDLY
ncbi:MAG: hypothetical protein RIS47_950, partial [Bacteroidota bacterium]